MPGVKTKIVKLMLKNTYRYLIIALILILHSSFLNSHTSSVIQDKKSEKFFLDTDTQWVDSVFNSLTPDERIAQLFMVAAYSNKNAAHEAQISDLIKKYNIGGLIFMQGGPKRQIRLVNKYQSEAKTPLLLAIDGEWSISMRLDSSLRYPRQMMMGAIKDDRLIYEFGKQVAKECKAVGIQVNFAPVIDVNNNPNNPVINSRSFGEDKYNVARKGLMYVKGMQDNDVLATGKHFPGHGDTDTDSHKTLPIINHSYKRIDSLELFPFKELINQGMGAVMVAHLYIPAIDSTANRATTLSPKVVTGLLKDSLGFEGLIFTDALNMNGVSKYYKPGEVEVKALIAGNDVLLFPEDVPKAIIEIRKAIRDSLISEKEINRRCKKILKAKYRTGLSNFTPIDTSNIYTKTNSSEAKLLLRKITENALTLIKNNDSIIPVKNLESKKMASVAFGANKETAFQQYLRLYADVKSIQLPKKGSQNKWDIIRKGLEQYDIVFVSTHNTNRSPKYNFGVSSQSIDFIEELASKTNVVLNLQANPYALNAFETKNIKSILVSYNDRELTQELAAQLCFGGIAAKGMLPVSVGEEFPVGTSIETDSCFRLKYTIPEELGINTDILKAVDSIVYDAIEEKATPGAQLLIAKKGKVFYHKAFGYHTYDKKRPVNIFDLYDLASITKITASTVSLMKLYEEGKFSLDSKLGDYLPELDTTDKADLSVLDVLTHQARLTPWIPFYYYTLDEDNNFLDSICCNKESELYSVKVCDDVYITEAFRDSMYRRISESELREKKEYKYSDVGYYLFHKIIENLSGEKLNDFVYNHFYASLGAYTMGYLPLQRFDKENIVPTQNDDVFRKQLIQGYVHDPGAAMLGGVAGHAGVFSNANDLAKFMQMLLNKGSYADKKYFNPQTVETYTSCPFCGDDNRRGIGFDKPQMDYNKYGPTCQCVSGLSFGHTGFTGTIAWADPDKEIVYIFLSNRINPDQENKKLIKMDVRTKIQEVIYKALPKIENVSDEQAYRL